MRWSGAPTATVTEPSAASGGAKAPCAEEWMAEPTMADVNLNVRRADRAGRWSEAEFGPRGRGLLIKKSRGWSEIQSCPRMMPSRPVLTDGCLASGFKFQLLAVI